MHQNQICDATHQKGGGGICGCGLRNIQEIKKKTIRIFVPFSIVKCECLDQF